MLSRRYGRERVGVSIWRDIHDRWMELQRDPHAKMAPMTAGTGSGYIFIRGNGLTTNGGFWVDLAVRARLTKGPDAQADEAGDSVSRVFRAK